MIGIRTFAVIALLQCAFTANVQADPASTLSARVKALVVEACNLWSSVADDIWPGASALQAPFVYVRDREEYAIGFPASLKGFIQTARGLYGKS